MNGKKQFTKEESDHNKKIASLRIRVEGYMERSKNWHLFDKPILISVSDIASDAWIVIACFSNFLPPIASQFLTNVRIFFLGQCILNSTQ